jgi:hypothetical protein
MKKYNIKSDQVDNYIRKAKDQAERQRLDNKTAVVIPMTILRKLRPG